MNEDQAATMSYAPSTILSRLRKDTRSEHDAVEQVLDLMAISLTREGYCERLKQFHGFYAPLERALQESNQGRTHQSYAGSFSLATQSALVTRLNKTMHLQKDLRYLGVVTEILPFCRNLPPLDTQAQILGCLYVLEGATLGGRIITKHIRAVLGITPGTGGRFFEFYGGDTSRMWQLMQQLLISGAPDVETENHIVTNAILTFSCLRIWCESFQKLLDNGTTHDA
jgi:heme oxygenase